MMVGLTTWADLTTIDGSVLLIVNAAAGDEALVEEALRALSAKVAAEALHVIAPPAWQRWLEERGQPAERLLLCVDPDGREVELTHFLHSSAGLGWVVTHGFRAVMGALPHNLYNEEVQGPFEQQVCLFLGDGHLLAHTLPHSYVYVFDTPALVRRFGRAGAVERYTKTARHLVDDLHDLWRTAGKPALDDTDRHDVVMAALGRHLDPRLLAFDEMVPAFPLVTQPADQAVAAQLATLLAALLERDRRLADLEQYLAERIAAVETRDRIIVEMREERNEAVDTRERINQQLMAERNEAVAMRDGIIGDLRAEMDQRLVRVALKIMRRLKPPR